MDDYTSALIVSVIVLAVNLCIIYYIIQSANQTKLKKQYLEIQIRLLMKIAEKQGATKDEIDQCITPKIIPKK